MYEVTAYWYEEGVLPLQETHRYLDDAEGSGQKLGCMAGIRLVEVRDQEGQLQAFWDKTLEGQVNGMNLKNLWQTVGPKSRELSRLTNEIINQAMRDRVSTTEAARRLRAARPLIKD